MAQHRTRYVKVALFEEVKTHLQDARVVGQGSDYLLLERAAPKLRAKDATKTRKPQTNAKGSTTTGHVVVSSGGASSKATEFPGSAASNG